MAMMQTYQQGPSVSGPPLALMGAETLFLKSSDIDSKSGQFIVTKTGKWSQAKQKTAIETMRYINTIPPKPRKGKEAKTAKSSNQTTYVFLTGAPKKMQDDNAIYLDLIPYYFISSWLQDFLQSNNWGNGISGVDVRSVEAFIQKLNNMDASEKEYYETPDGTQIQGPAGYHIRLVTGGWGTSIVNGVTVSGMYDILKEIGLSFNFLRFNIDWQNKMLEQIRDNFTYRVSEADMMERSKGKQQPTIFQKYQSEIIKVKIAGNVPKDSNILIQDIIEMDRASHSGKKNQKGLVLVDLETLKQKGINDAILQKYGTSGAAISVNNDKFKREFLNKVQEVYSEVDGQGRRTGFVDITGAEEPTSTLPPARVVKKTKASTKQSNKVGLMPFSFVVDGTQVNVPEGLVVVTARTKKNAKVDVRGAVVNLYRALGITDAFQQSNYVASLQEGLPIRELGGEKISAKPTDLMQASYVRPQFPEQQSRASALAAPPQQLQSPMEQQSATTTTGSTSIPQSTTTTTTTTTGLGVPPGSSLPPFPQSTQ